MVYCGLRVCKCLHKNIQTFFGCIFYKEILQLSNKNFQKIQGFYLAVMSLTNLAFTSW